MHRSLREAVQSFGLIENAVKVLRTAANLGYVALVKQNTGPAVALEVGLGVGSRPLSGEAIPDMVKVPAVRLGGLGRTLRLRTLLGRGRNVDRDRSPELGGGDG